MHFLGLRSDVPRLLKSADIVVMSSHWEGFGLAAVEGMAACKPVVASNVPGLAEIVNGYGFLFDEGDVQKLREIIKKLFCDKPLYDEVAYKCLKRALDFDIEKMLQEYWEVYTVLC